MDFNVSFLTHSAMNFGAELTPEFSKLILPAGEAKAANGGFGKLIFQEIKAGRFSILQQKYQLKEKLSLLYRKNGPVLQIITIRQASPNGIRIVLGGVGEVILHKGQFIINYSPSVEEVYSFEKSVEPEIEEIIIAYFPLEVLQQFSALFPLLHSFLETVHHRKASLLFKQPGWGNPQVNEIIESMLYYSGEEAMRRLLFDKKIKELLFILLLQEYTNAAIERRVIRKNIEAVYEAKNFLENNVNKFITIKKLAQQVGLNEVKLKTSFKLVFAISLSEFMLMIKMKKAWRWVMETDKPVKEIAKLTGYATTQNFLTAFRKNFHCTPGSLRKKHN